MSTQLANVAEMEQLGAVAPGEEADDGKQYSRRALIRRRFLRNKIAVAGLVCYALLVALAIAGPLWISRWGYTEIERGAYLTQPSRRHWLGTNQLGRDIFALSMRGLGQSLMIGLVVGALSTLVAAVVGTFAAYFQGWFERISLWTIDLLLVMPQFVLLAIILRSVDGSGSIWILIGLLSIFSWMLTARVVRSVAMSVRERDYVAAARYMGVPGWRIVFRHIIPNISSLLIVTFTLGVAGAVLGETALSYFGFGIRAPETSLGTLIGVGARQATTFPWIFYAGAVPLVLMVTSVNFIGDGLRDALDPTSHSGGKA